MATRKPMNPELAAAAKNIGVAARHIRRAINQKLDEIGTAASGELAKARQAAVRKSGQAKRDFDGLIRKAEGRLKKLTAEAKVSLHRAVGKAEKKLEAAKQAAAKKAPAKKGATRKAAAKPAKKAPAKRPAARRPAA
jgi:hypothetical protein